jgi:phage FluMu protein Com
MAIEFRCSQCNQLLRVPDDSGGRSARCPKCQSLMQVPAATTASTDPSPSGPPRSGPAFGGSFSSGTAPTTLHPPVPPTGGSSSAASFGPSPTKPQGESPFGGPPQSPSANPFAGPALPPKPPGNPFGDGGASSAASLNPYAAPAGGYAYSYQPGYPGSGLPRPGLPWELKPNDFGSWWQTTKLVMLEPSQAFSIMRQTGGLGQPLMYALWGQTIGFVAQMIWYVPLLGIIALNERNGGEMLVFQLVFNLVGGVIGLVAGVFIGLFLGAAIQHLCLRLVGGATQPYETTFRVLAFVQGSFGWLNIIPIFGPLVGSVWGIVAMIIGQANAHECSIGKSVGAFFLSIVLGCAILFAIYMLIVLIVVAIVAAIAAAAGAQ